MRRAGALVSVAAAVLIAASLNVTPANAAPIRECGSANGGAIYNITTRIVACRKARRFARRSITDPACAEDRYCRYGGFRCTHTYARGENDMRCVDGRRVIRFQY